MFAGRPTLRGPGRGARLRTDRPRILSRVATGEVVWFRYHLLERQLRLSMRRRVPPRRNLVQRRRTVTLRRPEPGRLLGMGTRFSLPDGDDLQQRTVLSAVHR